MEQLPLVFVFGIATSPSTLQCVLPHSVSSLLCIELFQSLSCTQHLATVIDKVDEARSPKPHSQETVLHISPVSLKILKYGVQIDFCIFIRNYFLYLLWSNFE